MINKHQQPSWLMALQPPVYAAHKKAGLFPAGFSTIIHIPG